MVGLPNFIGGLHDAPLEHMTAMPPPSLSAQTGGRRTLQGTGDHIVERTKTTVGFEPIGQLLEPLGDSYEPPAGSFVPSFERGRSDRERLSP
jgi:hypothetical protein